MQNQKGNIGVLVSFIIVVLLVGAVIYGLMHKGDKIDSLEGVKGVSPDTAQVNDDQPSGNVNDVVKDTNNTNKNMEQISKKGDTLVMNYTGRLTNGTVFDSNVDPKFNHVQPFEFTLGAGQVIAGWDEGLVGMKIGEKKTLTIPPEKAYGSRSIGSIPANSTLVFDVELVGIK